MENRVETKFTLSYIKQQIIKNMEKTLEQKEIEFWEKRSAMVTIKGIEFKLNDLKSSGHIIPDIVFDLLEKELKEIEFENGQDTKNTTGDRSIS